MQLIEVARLPHRPSDLLELAAAGYGPEARLAVDVALTSYALAFERMRDATVEKDAPPRSKRAKPQIRVPKHSEAELLAVLGIDPDDADEETMATAYDPAMWDGVDWGDGDEGGG